MKIITAKYIYKDSQYLQNQAILFDEKIIKIAPLEELRSQYPDIEITQFSKNSVIYPGFVNMHTHLEFSANKATLDFGNFTHWLYSVFEHRDTLTQSLDSNAVQSALQQMLQSGVTTFGAISSFGLDMQACKDAQQRVIYFNEVIGSNPAAIDALFDDFKERLSASIALSDSKFFPAVAIHSPYSVHPVLLRESLKLANKDNLPVSAHLLESQAEREWLEHNSGDFLELFENFFKTSKAVNTISGFLDAFQNTPTLFTHCTQATPQELEYLNQHGHTVIHCPRSNRLLGCGRLNIEAVKNSTLGTDGLSSNYSLSLLDELKAALMLHSTIELKELALKLIESVTTNATKALQMPLGTLKEGYFADFAIFTLPKDLPYEDNASLALSTILHANHTDAVYITGKQLISIE